MSEFNEFFVKANGLNLCVRERGNPDGPPVLLLMGLGCQMTYWPEAMLQRLEHAGCRVLTMDNRDIGLSEKLHSHRKVDTRLAFLQHRLGLAASVNYTLYDMAADTAALIDALQLSPVHLVGVSMGGMIAQIVAARYAQKVASLSLMMTSGNDHRLPLPELSLIWKMSRRRSESDTEAAVIKRWMGFWKAIQSPDYPAHPDHLRQVITESYRRNYSPGGTIRQMQAILGTPSLYPLLRAIECPTCIIHGRRDPLIRPAAARALERRIPKAQLHLIPGMGHDLPEALVPTLTGHILTGIKTTGSSRPQPVAPLSAVR